MTLKDVCIASSKSESDFINQLTYEMASKADIRRRFTIFWGPAGTGKTTRVEKLCAESKIKTVYFPIKKQCDEPCNVVLHGIEYNTKEKFLDDLAKVPNAQHVYLTANSDPAKWNIVFWTDIATEIIKC